MTRAKKKKSKKSKQHLKLAIHVRTLIRLTDPSPDPPIHMLAQHGRACVCSRWGEPLPDHLGSNLSPQEKKKKSGTSNLTAWSFSPLISQAREELGDPHIYGCLVLPGSTDIYLLRMTGFKKVPLYSCQSFIWQLFLTPYTWMLSAAEHACVLNW